MKSNKNMEKFYDFIDLYHLIIKNCTHKKGQYTINLSHLNNNLHLQIINNQTEQDIFSDKLSCDEMEYQVIANTIANDFIVNHPIILSSFKSMNYDDLRKYYLSLDNPNIAIIYQNDGYYQTNGQKMIIHELNDPFFTLRIYHYKGLEPITEHLHQLALDKINKQNKILIKK